MIQTGGGWLSYIRADEESGECLSTSIVCGDFGMPLYSENLVIRHNVIYSEYARCLDWAGSVSLPYPIEEPIRSPFFTVVLCAGIFPGWPSHRGCDARPCFRPIPVLPGEPERD